MMDLDEKEQKQIRIALLWLRRRVGGWVPLSGALGFKPDTLEKVANGRGRSVTASMALRVARILDAPMETLLSGRYLPGACPRCGHVPDFAEDPTIVEDGPRPAPGGSLRLVK
ncbi:MAG: hypothetical protein HY369_02875 [Candidatus Aenigmarchaeota archaeon]|nr:hypothetical protein [Candidatus Aenigmarchaeota archaeon]